MKELVRATSAYGRYVEFSRPDQERPEPESLMRQFRTEFQEAVLDLLRMLLPVPHHRETRGERRHPRSVLGVMQPAFREYRCMYDGHEYGLIARDMRLPDRRWAVLIGDGAKMSAWDRREGFKGLTEGDLRPASIRDFEAVMTDIDFILDFGQWQ